MKKLLITLVAICYLLSFPAFNVYATENQETTECLNLKVNLKTTIDQVKDFQIYRTPRYIKYNKSYDFSYLVKIPSNHQLKIGDYLTTKDSVTQNSQNVYTFIITEINKTTARVYLSTGPDQNIPLSKQLYIYNI